MDKLVELYDAIQIRRMETARNLRMLAALEGNEDYLEMARIIERVVIEADMRTMRMIQREEEQRARR